MDVFFLFAFLCLLLCLGLGRAQGALSFVAYVLYKDSVVETRSPEVHSWQAGEAGGADDAVLVQAHGPDNGDSRWCRFQTKSESEGRRRPMSQLGHSQAEGERESFLLFILFILFRPSEHWMEPTGAGEGPRFTQSAIQMLNQ